MVSDMDDFERRAQYEYIRAESERILDPERDAELRADLERRRADLAQLRYSEPTVTSDPPREQFMSDAEAAAVQQFVERGNAAEAAAAYWRGVIADAIREERAFMVELVGMSIGELLREDRQALERDFKAKLLELRCDLIERMTSTLETLRRVAGEHGVTDLPKWPKTGNGSTVN
jgi:hypothetical protein